MCVLFLTERERAKSTAVVVYQQVGRRGLQKIGAAFFRGRPSRSRRLSAVVCPLLSLVSVVPY
jgi:hypothetical protein